MGLGTFLKFGLAGLGALAVPGNIPAVSMNIQSFQVTESMGIPDCDAMIGKDFLNLGQAVFTTTDNDSR